MSYYQLFRDVIGRLKRRRWGVRVEIPDKPAVDTGVEPFAQELYQALGTDSPIVLSAPIRFTRTYSGPAIQVSGNEAAIGYVQPNGTTSGSAPATLRVRVVTVGDDTLTVRDSDSSAPFIVLKPYELRRSSFDQKTINGITYVYTGPQTRTAGTSTEAILPAYTTNDELILGLVEDGYNVIGIDGQPVSYVDVNVGGRRWAESSIDGTTPAARWTVVDSSRYTAELPTLAITGASYTKTITNATNASPIVITTSTDHGLITEQVVTISGVGGNTAANGTWVITRLTATTFALKLEYLTSPHVTSSGSGAYTSGGTVTHDIDITCVGHRFDSLEHVVISGVEGCTNANGEHTIDSGLVAVSDMTGEGSSPIIITTEYEHGFTAGTRVRVEGIDVTPHSQITIANGHYYCSTPSSTTLGLYSDSGLTTPVVGDYAYDFGGRVARLDSFRLVGIDGDAAYTSGGEALISGQITVDVKDPDAAALTDVQQGDATTSTNSERQAAAAYSASLGFDVGLPIRIRTASRTIYALIVGVPGTERFPYTDPQPLPFYKDNIIAYTGPRATGTIVELALGLPEMVAHMRLKANVKPFYASESFTPITPLTSALVSYRSAGGGGATIQHYGKTFNRWDGYTAYLVNFAGQQVRAAEAFESAEFSGATITCVLDVARQGTFSGGVEYVSTPSTWATGTAYAAQSMVKYRTGGATTAYNHFRAMRDHGLAWNNATNYVVGDVVRENVPPQTAYYCIQAHVNQQPSISPTYWVLLTPKANPETWLKLARGEAWVNTIDYVRGDYVLEGGAVYLCLDANGPASSIKQPPDDDYWAEVDQDVTPQLWASGTSYSEGNIVYHNKVLYISLTNANLGNDPEDGEPDWEEATRLTYTDGGIFAGTRASRSSTATIGSTANHWGGDHPDTLTVGWTFKTLGVNTAIHEQINPTQVILEVHDLEGQIPPAAGGQIFHQHSDALRYPRINLDFRGQLVSTNDDHYGVRMSRTNLAAVWNPPCELNPTTVDLPYDSRLEVVVLGVGNPPGVREADELTSYSEGTVTIVDGVVTLSGGTWPTWAGDATITVAGTTNIIEVSTRDSDTQLTLVNLSYQAAPASEYTLNPGGTPAQYLTVFLTFVLT